MSEDVTVFTCVALAPIYRESLGGSLLGFIGPWRLSRRSIRGWNGGTRRRSVLYIPQHTLFICQYRLLTGMIMVWRGRTRTGCVTHGMYMNVTWFGPKGRCYILGPNVPKSGEKSRDWRDQYTLELGIMWLVTGNRIKVWGFHGSDYEECRLLGYKTPVSTTQETLIFFYTAQPVNVMHDLRFSRRWLRRMPSSVMWRRVALVRTDVSEEHSASIIRVTIMGELGATLTVTGNRRKLLRNSWYGGAMFLRNVSSYKSDTV
jgi:hypothetical protein